MIVSTGGKVAWAEDFGTALASVIGGSPTAIGIEQVQQPQTQDRPSLDDKGLSELATRAQRAWDSSQEALKNGDWESYGRWMKDLEETILQMNRIAE